MKTGRRSVVALDADAGDVADILGARRATISVAAAALKSAGVISYTPGAVTIRSRRELLKAACGCYKMIGSLPLARIKAGI